MPIDLTSLAGEYQAADNDSRLVLRVDFGRPDSLNVLSGDLYLLNGGNEEFHHSFLTTALITEESTETRLALSGPVNVFAENIPDIARIDLVFTDRQAPSLVYTFYTLTASGRRTRVRLNYLLEKSSEYFRSVELEVDQVATVPWPQPFDTGSLPDSPDDLPVRSLSFDQAYRDVGIDMQVSTGQQDVPLTAAGDDGLWTDEELHAAMVDNFSQYQEQPQWRLYLLLATQYINPGVLGIMFDSNDRFPRQGAAVFARHPLIAEAPEAERNREYLFTIVHELGHAFNFLHSFQKGIFDAHGVLPRPDALSWMNYPQIYPYGYAYPDGWNGTAEFWKRFRFQFDPFEVLHLRHHDSMEVMMGGMGFGGSGHLEERAFALPSREKDLSLTLWVPPVLEFMENIEADIRLRNESDSELEINSILEPSAGTLELLIRRPGEKLAKKYRDIKQICAVQQQSRLQPGEAVYQELAVAYGLRYWFIDEPGTYEMQAIVHMPDGRKICSTIQRTRVLHPDTEADRLAQDFFNHDTGTYFALEGSRIPLFDKAVDTLTTIRERLPTHRVARQTGVLEALKDTRVFKRVATGTMLHGDQDQAAKKLLSMLNADIDHGKIDTVMSQSHLKTLRYLKSAARCLAKAGQTGAAEATLDLSAAFLRRINAPQSAQHALRSFASALLPHDHA